MQATLTLPVSSLCTHRRCGAPSQTNQKQESCIPVRAVPPLFLPALVLALHTPTGALTASAEE